MLYRVRYPKDNARISAGGYEFSSRPLYFHSLPAEVRAVSSLEIVEVEDHAPALDLGDIVDEQKPKPRAKAAEPVADEATAEEPEPAEAAEESVAVEPETTPGPDPAPKAKSKKKATAKAKEPDLAALYEEHTGKAPDGRWGEDRLREELQELGVEV